MPYKKLIFLALAILMLAACDKGPFDVHPYDTNYNGGRDLNDKNIATIESRFADRDTLRVAFISDTHLWHEEFKAEVNSINANDTIDFVVHCGDFTDTGTTREYEWGWDIIKKLRKPYVVVIGNHDFLGTGDSVWKTAFGKRLDFSFIAGRIKFVCLNTNATEYDYMAAVPNFEFLEEEAKADSTSFDRTVIVMHAAPYSDQFNNNVPKAFNYMIHLFPGLQCCIYGHDHHQYASELFNDGLMWHEVDAACHREYNIFTFTPQGYSYDTIHY